MERDLVKIQTKFGDVFLFVLNLQNRLQYVNVRQNCGVLEKNKTA